MISISNTITINNNIWLQIIAIMHVEKMMRQSDHEQVRYNSNKFVDIEYHRRSYWTRLLLSYMMACYHQRTYNIIRYSITIERRADRSRSEVESTDNYFVRTAVFTISGAGAWLERACLKVRSKNGRKVTKRDEKLETWRKPKFPASSSCSVSQSNFSLCLTGTIL
jgi:hypothetical protein